MNEPARVFLSAGSNLGDRKGYLAGAVRALESAGVKVVQVSPVYETEPVGVHEQPWFLNIAVEAATRLTPRQLLDCCLGIEAEQGRRRPYPGAPRVLDLDVLLYNGLVIDEPGLQIPHPHMTERRFVLEPLVCIAPRAIHPVLGATMDRLLAACPDRSRVTVHSEMP